MTGDARFPSGRLPCARRRLGAHLPKWPHEPVRSGSPWRKIQKLTTNQARLVQLSYEGLVTSEVLTTEQQRLEAEKLQVQRLLDAGVDTLSWTVAGFSR